MGLKTPWIVQERGRYNDQKWERLRFACPPRYRRFQTADEAIELATREAKYYEGTNRQFRVANTRTHEVVWTSEQEAKDGNG